MYLFKAYRLFRVRCLEHEYKFGIKPFLCYDRIITIYALWWHSSSCVNYYKASMNTLIFSELRY